MAGIDTTLRQWCRTCQRATISRICYACFGNSLVCSVCHHDEADWDDDE